MDNSSVLKIDDKPLRILAVVNVAWDPRLGAARVWIELAEEWTKAGHVVEKFCLTDAFPTPASSPARAALRLIWFPFRAATFIRKNADRFDVIDALISTLPFSKQSLRFRGLLVARSVGLYRLYNRFERTVEKHWPGRPRGKFIGRIFYALTRREFWRASDKSVREADLLNVPNDEEAVCLREEMDENLSILVQPYGLTAGRGRVFLEAVAPGELRLAQKRICFIGMWSLRKGAGDWGSIIRLIRARVPEAQFRFLGTMIDAEAIRSDLAMEVPDRIELISDYQPGDLPALLADCTVGAFPSYVEGFGLAVLEQLAAGLPTVAYDTPGPRDLLGVSLPEFLVPKGDIDAFAAGLCKVLEQDVEGYRKLSERSAQAAAQFSWPTIAEATLNAYRTALEGGPIPGARDLHFARVVSGGGAR